MHSTALSATGVLYQVTKNNSLLLESGSHNAGVGGSGPPIAPIEVANRGALLINGVISQDDSGVSVEVLPLPSTDVGILA
jgi:hypothetical protein